MTGYTVHSGTSDQYSSGWDAIFGGQKPTSKTGKKSTSKKSAAKGAAAKKSAPKKSARKGKK